MLSSSPDLPPPLDLWNDGVRFTVPVPAPLAFTVEDEDAGEMPVLFDTGAQLLMRAELLAVLRASGETNLDAYDAVILDEASGQEHAYQAVNIVVSSGA